MQQGPHMQPELASLLLLHSLRLLGLHHYLFLLVFNIEHHLINKHKTLKTAGQA